jgi:hypothetical protein
VETGSYLTAHTTNDFSNLSILIFSTPSEFRQDQERSRRKEPIHLNGTCDKPAARDNLLVDLADNGKTARTMSASVR